MTPTTPKGLKIIRIPYSGPDVQPQMQLSSMHPSLSTGYDQALGVIKDSINAANPLANLNFIEGNYYSTESLPSKILKPQYIPDHKDQCLSSQQVQHLYECLRKEIDYNPNQIQQFTSDTGARVT